MIHTHHDGGLFDIRKEDLNDPENLVERMFRNMFVSKPYSFNGMLPYFRFQVMDPTEIAWCYDLPEKYVPIHSSLKLIDYLFW